MRRAQFREGGKPHDLLVITDLSRTLREEERLAWQRLLRVLGHELNNSLAPIRSMAATLSKLIATEPLPADWRDDAGNALDIIGDRAEALARFMARYTALARLPPPHPVETSFDELARRTARLEQRITGQGRRRAARSRRHRRRPDRAGADQPDPERDRCRALDRRRRAPALAPGRRRDSSPRSIDGGPGLPPSENLFVPFFTTKRGGSGIGLVLARQIVEAHGGSLTLENRDDARGCVARLRLPAAASALTRPRWGMR